MSIKVFYTPFQYRGITETLFNLAVDHIKGSDYSKILYIAPTPRKVRDTKQKFHNIAGYCYIPPEMMTIKQLSKRLYSIYGDKTVISQPLIPIVVSQLSNKGIGFASIIANFINEIKQYHPDKDIETISNLLKDIFYELNIPEEIYTRAVGAIGIFKAYQELLIKQSVVDEDDVMSACPALIKKQNYSPETLILDGFYELTRSEETILKVLIENAKHTFISIPHNTEYTEITNSYINFIRNNFKFKEIYLSSEEQPVEPLYYSYPVKEEEIDGIAKHIKYSFISGKIKDLGQILVIFPKLYEYSDMVARIFKRYGIPHTISISEPAGKKRPFLDLISMLESVADEYPRLTFTRFLTSPYFKNIPSIFREFIPALCLRSGIIKGKDAWLNIHKSEVRKDNRLPNLEKELRWVFRKLTPLESIMDKGSYSQYCEVVIKILDDFDFSDVNNQDTNLKEQVIEILKRLPFIDYLISDSSSFTHCTLLQFINALKHVLNVTVIEIEGTGVQVMGYFETRGIDPRYIYFGGLKDGDLPSKPDIDHILPDSVRTKLDLVNLKKYLLLQKFLFHRTIESTKNLHISYPSMEGDKLFLPSPFLSWNREVKEQIPGILSKEEELLRKGKNPLGLYITEIQGIGDKLIKNKFGEKSYIRVTDIDSYRTCPRKFFIEKVINLEPPEIKEYEVEAVLLGTIAHEIMQNLISEPFLNIDEFRAKAEFIIDKLLSHKSLEDYWKKLIRDSFLSILPEIYELESSIIDEGYSFMKAEVHVKGEIIKGIKLKGKIDRIDKKVKTDTVELIDYKTGTTLFIGPQIITKGATLQLFIYAALLKSLGFKVERVGIYSLKDIKVTWIPGRNDQRNRRTIEDYIEATLRFLEETISGMRKGNFSATPLGDQPCRICSERPYCPYIQKTVKS